MSIKLFIKISSCLKHFKVRSLLRAAIILPPYYLASTQTSEAYLGQSTQRVDQVKFVKDSI